MPVINAQTVGNSYPASPGTGPAALSNVWNSKGGWFSVQNAGAFCQLQYGDLGSSHWVEEIQLGAGAFVVLPPNCRGIQFRNSVANAIATVTAQIAQGDEPPLAISSIGQTNVVSVASLNFQHGGVAVGTEPTLNFIDAAGVIAWTVVDNGAQTRVDLTPAFTSPALFPGAVGIGGNAGDTQISRLAAGVVGATTAFSSGPAGSGAGSAAGVYMGSLLALNGATSATTLFATSVTTTDSQYRFVMNASGTLTWGPGGASAQDSTFRRLAVGVLGDTATALSTGPLSGSFSGAQVAGTFIDNNGRITNFTAGTNVMLQGGVTADTTAEFQLQNRGVMAWGPGNAATDTTVQRVAAGVIQIGITGQGGRWAAQQPAAANLAFSAAVDADTVARYQVQADGTIKWGPGNAGADTKFERLAAGVLGDSGTALSTGPLSSGSRTANGVFVQNGSSTGGGIWSVGANTAFTALDVSLLNDNNPRFIVFTSGQLSWGPGNASPDIALIRQVNLPTGTGSFLELTLGAAFGYGTGTGGTATVAGTSLTLNKGTGQVSFTGQSNTASTSKTFVVTNSVVGADDVVLVSVNNSTTAAGILTVSTVVTAGSFTIVLWTTTANTTVTYSFNFAVIKGAVA